MKKENKLSLSEQNEFKGIINYLRNKSSNKIEDEIVVSASSLHDNESNRQPQNVTLFDDQSKYFLSNGIKDEWLKFEFKNNRVIPKGYTIRSALLKSVADCHPKTWNIEGSNDNNSWETIDEVKNCSYLNGKGRIHTFSINNPNRKEYKFIQMKISDKNWRGTDHIYIDSFELYGELI